MVEYPANVSNGSWLCRNALPEASRRGGLGRLTLRSLFSGLTMPHRGHERLNAHDVHDPGEIVGEHVQRHL